MAKLTDCKAEAAETIVWLKFAKECGYLAGDVEEDLRRGYDQVIGMLVRMIERPDQWTLPTAR